MSTDWQLNRQLKTGEQNKQGFPLDPGNKSN